MSLSRTPSFYLVCFLLSHLSGFAMAQKTLVYGRITEAGGNNPVAFANVAFKGTTIGTSSDQLGNFTLETNETYNQLTFSAVGYIDTTIFIKVHERQELKVYLATRDYMLSEVVINAGENPAFAILRKVVANKPINNPEKYNTYEYRSYNKVQFDLNNFSDKIKKNPLFRPFPFIWQYQDTMANGVRYLRFYSKKMFGITIFANSRKVIRSML
ncbi:MAG: carboxypeptidase-like regulatory domain-containing protein [Bacteroidetes bacterium]|nr:carboxypeptidase-like regulatory domain-containing protein [Bacteroidota bacterium]